MKIFTTKKLGRICIFEAKYSLSVYATGAPLY